MCRCWPIILVLAAGLAIPGASPTARADDEATPTPALAITPEPTIEPLSMERPFRAGSQMERLAIERFSDFWSMLFKERIQAKVRDVYAPDAYFNDTLAEVRGVDAIEAHLISSTQATEQVSIEILDVAESRGNYYFRWIMGVRFKKLRSGELITSMGMSHVRFDEMGRVVYHQDYWDAASGLFEHMPVVGGLIRSIRRNL